MALVIAPAYPLPGELVTISDSSTIGDVQVIELTSAPSASTMELGFLLRGTDQRPTTPLAIADNDWQTDAVAFDEPGEYGVTVYDLRQWSGAPSFAGDPGGELYHELIATYSSTLNVAAEVTLPLLTAGGVGATLQLAICNETVRAASLIDATTEAARVATLDSSVTAALTSLVGDAVSSMGTDLQTGVNDLRAKYEAHRILTGGPVFGVHVVADNTNAARTGDADSQEGAIALLNILRSLIISHLRNSSAQSLGTRWHQLNEDDLKNLPLTGSATTLAAATVLSADLRERCYERHRIQKANPASHINDDTTNVLAAPSDLDALIVAYFDALAVVNPAAVAGEPEGAVDAEHMYGFVRS